MKTVAVKSIVSLALKHHVARIYEAVPAIRQYGWKQLLGIEAFLANSTSCIVRECHEKLKIHSNLS